jgi:hypothetical protein
MRGTPDGMGIDAIVGRIERQYVEEWGVGNR